MRKKSLIKYQILSYLACTLKAHAIRKQQQTKLKSSQVIVTKYKLADHESYLFVALLWFLKLVLRNRVLTICKVELKNYVW